MSNIIKDIGEIHSRLFDSTPFLVPEIKYFVHEFEEKRKDREIEGLFTTLQNTIELKDSSLERTDLLWEKNLGDLNKAITETRTALDNIRDIDLELEQTAKLEANRAQRKKQWQQFIDDMSHKCKRVDNTFEEKRDELREFYADLERKLHIHK